MNNVWTELVVHHPKVSISPIDIYNRNEIELGPVDYRTSFINKSPYDITVIDRNGFRHTVNARRGFSEDCFIIRTELRIRNDSLKDIKSFLSNIDARFNKDLSIIRQVVLSCEFNSFNGTVVYIDHTVQIEEIKKAGGSIYCKPKDLVLSLSTIYKASAHPFSEDSIHDYCIPEGVQNQKLGSPVFKLELIDNSNEYSNRFVFAFGELHEVKTTKDLNRESGVYLTLMEQDILSDTGYCFVQRKYTIEEAKESLGLHKTKEDALTSGDIQLIRKEQLTKLEHSNNLLKQELSIQRSEIEKENLEREHQLKRDNSLLQERVDKLKADYDMLEHIREQERAVRKHDYESKSLDRKDVSEIIKFLPFVVMTIGALIAAFKKQSPSK